MTKNSIKAPEITFEKYRCPFGSDIDEELSTNYITKEDRERDKDIYREYYDDNNALKDVMEELRESYDKTPIVIIKGLGVLPLTDYTNPTKVFNLWVGNTNFDITHKIQELIEKIDGVELLETITRYRFRVGFGKLFKDSEVMSNITNIVKKHLKYQREIQK